MTTQASLLGRVPALWRGRFSVLAEIFSKRRAPLCLVGGCVRDLLLKRAPLDWDVMGEGELEAPVSQAAQSLGAGLVSHPFFRTFTLHFPDGTSLDVTTARRETYAHPAALPTVFPSTMIEDFSRRDFTVNALAAPLWGPEAGHVWDPTGGLADLKARRVRALHPQSFQDDPTRIFRAARYAARFGFKVEPKTLSWIKAAASDEGPARLTPARLRTELEKILLEESRR
jgi:tRNA nucleotidyltransferase (CCA-adding enzyme)